MRWNALSELSLGDALKDMGMPTAFGKQADFGGMAERKHGEPPLAIDQALQQAFIEVDEVGTEAAAVTAFGMAEISAQVGPELERVVFHANHPFAYVIRDTQTGVVLFAGRVVAP